MTYIFRSIVILCLCVSVAKGQLSQHCELPRDQNLYFNYLSVNNGLSQNSVTSIIQDSRGFIWIGTYDGLNRYDGFTNIIKRHESDNNNSLTANRVLCLHEFNRRDLLIGTEGGGLNIFNPISDQFLKLDLANKKTSFNNISTITSDSHQKIWVGSENHIAVIENIELRLKSRIYYIDFPESSNIKKIICDKVGNVWIGTSKGLYLIKKNNQYHDSISKFNKITAVGNLAITALFQDNKSNIWIGSPTKLLRAGFVGDHTENPLIIEDFTTVLFNRAADFKVISDITEDKIGNIWISSRRKGLFNFTIDNNGNPVNKKIYSIEQPFCNISDNSISSILIDSSNNLWAGGFEKGVNYSNLSTKKFYSFNLISSNTLGALGYRGKYVSVVAELRDELYIGTTRNGLLSYNKCTKELNSYKQLDSSNVTVIYASRSNILWFGGDKGLFKLLTRNGRKNIKNIRNDIIPRSITEDKLGNIWIATWDNIIIYTPETNKYVYLTTKDGLSSNVIFTLYQDPKDSIIWAGTIGGGLNRISYKHLGKYAITNYQNIGKNRKTSLISNLVWCIFKDEDGALWIGTDAGLNKIIIDRKSNISEISTITNKMLKDQKIVAIQEDRQRNLWLSSSQGLYRYNTLTGNTRRYTYRDGLQSNTLSEASFQDKDGWMYFGGINGLNYFKPEEITDNPFPAKTAIIDFRIFNQSIKPSSKPDHGVILSKDINFTDKISLSYQQNNFLLNFASLHYALPEDNKFRYKLEGYDKNWVETGADQRFAAYSNLDAKQYKFYLTSSNNDGVWNKHVKMITFIIEPAPWATWWAKTIYVLILIMLVWFVINFYHNKHHLKNQVFREKIEKEKLTELNEIKLNFFTNITHELRTPLNLIIGPIKELLQKSEEYDVFLQYRIELIHRNTLRLFNLINQVLDLRKISSESSSLIITQGDLTEAISEIKNSFDLLAEQKHISYQFEYHKTKVPAWFDKDKIEKTIYNLISNAFKHTPENGEIMIELIYNETQIQYTTATIIISDSGDGISDLERDKIFDMYYQSKKQNNIGTGIGLALAKKLIEIHKGEISVQTNHRGKGSSFKITFPVSKNFFRNDYIEESAAITSFLENSSSNKTERKQKSPKEIQDRGKKHILLLEDDQDQRGYIKSCLSEQFIVDDFEDGNLAFVFAVKFPPDLIIADLMMPKMNGIDFCKKIKGESKTSHIPVIIHSVKSNGRTYQNILDAGADDFITKPFNYTMLAIKIQNILKSRLHLLNNNYIDQVISPSAVEIPAVDEELIKKILKIIEVNMASPDFGVEKICNEVGMSRMHLHRRLHAITGKTASEFIREVRMKRAGQLLGSGSKRILEVMYEVGISNNSHFNKYFKEMYGISPKEYIKNKSNV